LFDKAEGTFTYTDGRVKSSILYKHILENSAIII